MRMVWMAKVKAAYRPAEADVRRVYVYVIDSGAM